ncbi:MAG: hypothetical protein JW860_08920 [Sedimentisphaerales bacterium]|nr:hypothetical protein [Sedimentisphaerales bacterium]
MSSLIKKKVPKNLVSQFLCLSGVILGASALALEFGFKADLIPPVILYTFEVLAVLLLWAGKVQEWRSLPRREFNWRKPFLDILLIVFLLFSIFLLPLIIKPQADSMRIPWLAFKIYLLVRIVIYMGRFSVRVTASGRGPTHVLLVSFVLIILIGAILLMLPSANQGRTLGFTDAVFTSTSATCVTGLIVRDTGSEFTVLGQTIILFLMQIGGLGIMIFGALFALLLGSPLSLRESIAMRDIMNEQSPGRIGRIVVFIIIVTVLMEGLGVLGLYGIWSENPEMPIENAYRFNQFFYSIFHSVSAFCNAGFSLQSDSLSSYRTCWQIYLIVCPLIIMGGLGFPVLNNLWSLLWKRLAKRLKINKPVSSPVKLTLHSRLALWTTGCLLLFGFLMLMFLELLREDNNGDFSVINLLDSLFNSITARTAGFNTVEIRQLGAGSKLVLILLMCIGGSPSSTAGGVKTVTFAVMVLAIYTTIRRQRDVVIFQRSIPIMIVRRVATLIMLYGLTLWMATLLLTITEHSQGTDMLDLLFEAASALGTVGLSTGVTAQLSLAGKWVIIVTMFVGRLGPLSLLAALTFNARPARYDYPKEPLVVG